ncbi:MAG TPA: sugar phosphate isomerase/epimerase family protein [Spirochaetia bacterium]|nr:sugar phosphate isomerase/epimerase family protein [Spirochaetia bacterium]
MISLAAFPKCWIEDISEGRMDLFEWIELSVQLECDGLEMYSRFLKSHEPGYLSEVRKRVESLGMTIPMMCYSPDFTNPDAEIREREIEKQIEIIRVTGELGGTYCRTLSGQQRPEVKTEQGIDWVVESIERSLRCAEACRVNLVIENHYKDGFWRYKEFAQKKDVFLAIVNRIDSPFFGVQYDPSNAVVAGDDPIDLLENVLPKVRTVHASDRYLLPGTTLEEMKDADGSLGYPKNLVHGVTGKGLIDYDGVFSRLAQAGFKEWISIEDGMNGLDEMKDSLDFLKAMRIKYFQREKK